MGKGPNGSDKERVKVSNQKYISNREPLKQGDILRLVDFGQQVGSEQSGVRPAIIVSNDVCNRVSHTITVVPITAVIKKKYIPTHVMLDSNKYGLLRESQVLCEQLRTIDKKSICEGVIATLDKEDYQKVASAIMTQLTNNEISNQG